MRGGSAPDVLVDTATQGCEAEVEYLEFRVKNSGGGRMQDDLWGATAIVLANGGIGNLSTQLPGGRDVGIGALAPLGGARNSFSGEKVERGVQTHWELADASAHWNSGVHAPSEGGAAPSISRVHVSSK